MDRNREILLFWTITELELIESATTIEYPTSQGLNMNTPLELDVGRALSLALRLKKRKSGANHTHTPKKVAISLKPR